MKWTEQEIKILKENYNINKKDLLFPNRTSYAIEAKAREIGLAKKQNPKRCAKLLDNNIINANIWGFIFSDGHLGVRGTLQINLNQKDINYLQYIADYLNVDIKLGKSKNTYKEKISILKYCRLQVSDKENIEKLKQKLQISNQKTYNPPQNLDFIQTKEELLAFLIGIIDGDGCISFKNNKFERISICLHVNWKQWFELFSIKLEEYYGFKLKILINKSRQNIVIVRIYKKEIYFLLKNFIIENNINYLERKWKT